MAHRSARFFIDPIITAFAEDIVKVQGLPTEQALLLPSRAIALRCFEFFKNQVPWLGEGKHLKIFILTPKTHGQEPKSLLNSAEPLIAAIIFPRTCFSTAKTFWQHTGEGISSRRAEVFRRAFLMGRLLVEEQGIHSMSSPAPGRTILEPVHPLKLTKASMNTPPQIGKGPQRYRKRSLQDESQAESAGATSNGSSREPNGTGGKDHVLFVEERFGRNLDSNLGASAKCAIRRRIAGALVADLDRYETDEMFDATACERGISGFSIDDVYLYPSGMSSIFNTHRTLMKSRGAMKSICFGWVLLMQCHRIARLICPDFLISTH